MSKKKELSWKTKYTEIKTAGKGGNAEVYIVSDSSGQQFALKQLENKGKESKARFQDEIHIMKKLKGQDGILPILDSNEAEFWYVMPVAIPIMNWLKLVSQDSKMQEVETAIYQLSYTLMRLHKEQIAHRDIKPANLYFYIRTICYGDFGLVDFPEKVNDITYSERNLGAKFTIAPEMMRHPDAADGLKADVYSLAKTIWMLFTEDELGFEGSYNYRDENITIRNVSWARRQYLAALEILLQDATDSDPDKRPTAEELYNRVVDWIKTSRNDHLAQEKTWDFLEKLLFADRTPESASWSDTDKILDVLNIISVLPVSNHMLFSNNGGLDLIKVERATEEGMIDIYSDLGSIYRLKPKRLYFERFNGHTEWNYFQLKFENVQTVFDDGADGEELLCEDYPGHYVSSRYFDYGVYDYDTGEELPESARLICRYSRGSLLFVMKTGLYNSIPGTYDGRHDRGTNEAFREYIESLIKIADEAKSQGKDPETALIENDRHGNPFPKVTMPYDAESLKAEREKRKKSEEFIKQNINTWIFILSVPFSSSDTERLVYRIDYREPGIEKIGRLKKIYLDEPYCLSKDGKIAEVKNLLSEAYYIKSIQEVNLVISELNKQVAKKCEAAGLEYLEGSNNNIFSATLQRGKVSPSHLFSKAEIKALMATADDRVSNVLVIDADGYARIVPDDEDRFLYPVTLESWQAGNMYVGKYSNLDSLDDTYLMALDGWRDYLKTGNHQYCDYLDKIDEKAAIEEVKSYM